MLILRKNILKKLTKRKKKKNKSRIKFLPSPKAEYNIRV